MNKFRISNLSHRLKGANADLLSNINLTVSTGETVFIYGKNGSGKSTLSKLMAGIDSPQSGEITLNGIPLPENYSSIALLFQNPDTQILAASVEEELAYGLENLRISPDEMHKSVEETLHHFQLTELRHRQPNTLSDGEKQLTALAALWIMRPKFLILDEANAFLDQIQSERLVNILNSLKQHCGIIWFSSRRHSIIQPDRCFRLNNCTLETFETAPNMQLHSTQKLEPKQFHYIRIPMNDAQQHIHLNINDLFHVYSDNPLSQLRIDNLKLNYGEILFLFGLSGSGKSTFGKILKGLIQPKTGNFTLIGNGNSNAKKTQLNTQTLNDTVGWCSANPESQFFAPTVEEEIGFILKCHSTKPPEILRKTTEILNRFGMDPNLFLNRSPHTLSGGEKRKIALCSILVKDYPIYLLDEPMVGLDDENAQIVGSVFLEIAQKNSALIWLDNNFSSLTAAGFHLD